jgi:hypothetical protein
VFRQLKNKSHDNFERKAWYKSDKFNNVWIWTCPKEHNWLNARRFPVVEHTYYGVIQEGLRGLEGGSTKVMRWEIREDTTSTCDPFGENLVKANLHGSG